MNSNTQQPTSLWGKLKSTFAAAAERSYSMMKVGLAPSLPIPGATGMRSWIDKTNQINTDKSKRVMRLERGSQPEAIGDRRFIRYASKVAKRKNSFRNNLDPVTGKVVMN